MKLLHFRSLAANLSKSLNSASFRLPLPLTVMEEIFLNNNIGDIKQMDYNNFLNIRKNIIEKEFSRMNDMQKKAVFRIKGPLLILAGAGSGKTTVLVNRISNLLICGFIGKCYSENLPRHGSVIG